MATFPHFTVAKLRTCMSSPKKLTIPSIHLKLEVCTRNMPDDVYLGVKFRFDPLHSLSPSSPGADPELGFSNRSVDLLFVG